MAITLTLVQHNTDEESWLKCLETCDEHAPVQQGGPLMLFLVLQRIQDRSEQTPDVLKMRVAQLDISKLKGEDVEQVKFHPHLKARERFRARRLERPQTTTTTSLTRIHPTLKIHPTRRRSLNVLMHSTSYQV